jgi:hypothetical protein
MLLSPQLQLWTVMGAVLRELQVEAVPHSIQYGAALVAADIPVMELDFPTVYMWQENHLQMAASAAMPLELIQLLVVLAAVVVLAMPAVAAVDTTEHQVAEVMLITPAVVEALPSTQEVMLRLRC